MTGSQRINQKYGSELLYVSKRTDGKYVIATLSGKPTTLTDLQTVRQLNRKVMQWYPQTGIHRMKSASEVE